MSQQIINVGTSPDDGTGDPLRTAMIKVQNNFSEFYTAISPTGRNVGIGTTTPSARLNVVAELDYDAVRITQTGTGNALVVEDSTNPDVTSFIVNKDGNVGINKNLPTFPLDVNGDINTSGKLRFNAGTKYIGFENGSYVLPAADLNINGSKAITVGNFNTYAPTLTGTGATGLWNISVADATYSTGSRANTFTIGTASTFVANGNFGINKASPQAKLHVGGDSIVDRTLTVGAINSSYEAIIGLSMNKRAISGSSTSNTGVYGFSSHTTGVVGITDSDSGDLGIGVYGEATDLGHGVYGKSERKHGTVGTTNAPLNSFYAGVAAVAYQGGVGISVESNTGIAINAKANTGPLAVFSNNTTYGIVTIDNWGRTGLANNIPAHRLSVNGPSYFGSTVQLTNSLLVGASASPGTSGQVLTSVGTTGAPIWTTISSGSGDTYNITGVQGDGQIHSQLFTTSGTWTAPHGVTRVKVYVIGGGAGGGGTVQDLVNGTYGVAAGPGGFAVGEYTVVPDQEYTITVGSGGYGNNYVGSSSDSSQNKGSSGSASSFGPVGGSALISASGGQSLGASTQGTSGAGAGGTLRNSSMNRYSYGGAADNITKFQIDFAAGIFNGSHRSYSLDSSVRNPMAWSVDSETAPGIGGIGAGDQGVAQGGVGGIIYLEWVEARVTPVANPYVTLGKLGVTGDQYYWHVDSPSGGTYHSFPVAASTETVVPFIADTDNNGWHVSGNKFQPTQAGYYDIKSAILVYFVEAIDDLSSDLSVHSVNYQMVKNGTQRIVGDSLYDDLNKDRAYTQDITNNNRAKTFQVSSVVYMNGTTDYIQFKVYSYLLACRVMGEYIAADTVTTINYSKYSANFLAYGGGSGTSSTVGSSIPNMSVFSTAGSQTFTIPSGVSKIKVTVVGAGGGGRGAAQPGSGQEGFGHGGAGGGTTFKTLTGLTPGATLSVIIGAGGAGSTGPNLGVTGGTSSVSSGTQTISTISATGGIGGQGAWYADVNGGVSIGNAAEGGIGTGGDLNIRGGAGGFAYEAGAGAGGSSHFGGGGVLKLVSYVESYTPPTYGGGGAGGIYQGNGRPGASGLVIFEY